LGLLWLRGAFDGDDHESDPPPALPTGEPNGAPDPVSRAEPCAGIEGLTVQDIRAHADGLGLRATGDLVGCEGDEVNGRCSWAPSRGLMFGGAGQVILYALPSPADVPRFCATMERNLSAREVLLHEGPAVLRIDLEPPQAARLRRQICR
jgi:hypothetical protein